MSNILNRFNEQADEQFDELNSTSEKYLTFLIDKQFYAFHINDVVEIIEMMEITPVPEFPDYAKGIINLRGILIPIIDVRLRFSKNEMDYNERTCIIILNLKGIQVGFIVDTVDEVIDIDKANISGVPKISDTKTRKYIEGVGKLTNKIVMLVNAQKMLNDEEIKGLESMSGMEADDIAQYK
ncbi:MAG: purine-binding chemotaxis protein CheW [Ruminococcus sp.]|nr:purine-binding chemotaxis protein CheW [Ruminococcus sp.]